MKIKPFKLERYFAQYEFSVKYSLCSSDCDGLAQSQLLSFADQECQNLWQNLKLGYTETLGSPLLRKEIAKLYKNIKPEEIFVLAPGEGIFIAINSLLDQEDHIICTFPGYQSLYQIAENIGCEVTKWQPDEKNGWRFNPEFLIKNIKTNTKLIVFNFPHNPTGYLPSKEDFEKIIKIAKEHNLYVFSDEMYRFLEYDSTNRLPSASDLYDKAISLSGLSKSFGLAGLRIGWLTTKNQALYQEMAAYKDYTTICNSASSEVLALIALRNTNKIIQDNLTKVQRNLGLLDNFFLKYQKIFSWIKPKAGTIAFPKININLNSEDFCEKVIKEAGIMLLPSTVYDYGDKHFRLGFGRENMPEALAQLEKFI